MQFAYILCWRIYDSNYNTISVSLVLNLKRMKYFTFDSFDALNLLDSPDLVFLNNEEQPQIRREASVAIKN